MTSCQIGLAATSFALALLVSAPAVAEDPEHQITIERIVESIQANYDRIQDAHFRMEETIRAPGRRRLLVEAPNVSVVSEPLMKRTFDVYLRGECVRKAEVEGRLKTTWIYSDGVWTEQTPRSQRTFRRDELPGVSLLDPRQIGAQRSRDTLIDQLRSSKILEVREVNEKQDQRFYDVLLQLKDDRARGATYRCRFDAWRNFLPVHVAYSVPEQGEWLTIDIGYSAVLPQTWLMAHAVTTYPLSDEVHEYHVVGDVAINEGLGDELFKVEPSKPRAVGLRVRTGNGIWEVAP